MTMWSWGKHQRSVYVQVFVLRSGFICTNSKERRGDRRVEMGDRKGERGEWIGRKGEGVAGLGRSPNR